MDAEASAHTNLNKDQDPEATSDTKGPEYMDAEAIFLLEVP